jgi:hypothetical protein
MGHPFHFFLSGRDTKFTASFDAVFVSVDIKVIRTPVRPLVPTPLPRGG